MSAVDSNIIIACATVIAALIGLIGILLGMIHKNAKATAQKADVLVGQVRNSHSINLRDDLDVKFAGLDDKLDGVVNDVGGIKGDLRLIRRDQSADRETASNDRRATAEAHALADQAIQLAREALERTKPKHQIPTQGETQ